MKLLKQMKEDGTSRDDKHQVTKQTRYLRTEWGPLRPISKKVMDIKQFGSVSRIFQYWNRTPPDEGQLRFPDTS